MADKKPEDKKPEDKKPDLLCHRWPIPFSAIGQNPITGVADVVMKLGNTNCAGAKCTLWNAAAGECFDVTAAKAQVQLARTAEDSLGLQRLANAGSDG